MFCDTITNHPHSLVRKKMKNDDIERLSKSFDILSKTEPEGCSNAEMSKTGCTLRNIEDMMQELAASLSRKEKLLCIERAKDMFRLDFIEKGGDLSAEPDYSEYHFRDLIDASGRRIPMEKKHSHACMLLYGAYMDDFYQKDGQIGYDKIATLYLAGQRIPSIVADFAESISLHLERNGATEKQILGIPEITN